MDIVMKLLFWIHMVSLGLGGVASFGIPIVGSRMPTATAETRPLLIWLADTFSKVGRAAIILLLITGPSMYFLGPVVPQSMPAFITKMVLVAILLVLVIYAGINAKRAQTGDMAAARRSPMLGMAAATTFVLILLAATFAFQ